MVKFKIVHRKSRKLIFSLFLTINIVTLASAQNLIINPGAETTPIASPWIDVNHLGNNIAQGGGIWWLPNGNTYGPSTGVSGNNYFSAGNLTSLGFQCELYQDIDVSSYTVSPVSFTFTGWMATWTDTVRMIVEFRDFSGILLDSLDTQKLTYNDNGKWHKWTDARNAPVGTTTVRIRLIGINGFSLIDAYFDQLSLTVGTSIMPSQNLIVNPDAETIPIAGSWVDVSHLGTNIAHGGGIWWLPNGNTYGPTAGVSGNNYFSAGDQTNIGFKCELDQDIDVSSYTVNPVSFTFDGWMAGWNNDTTRMIVEFRNVSGIMLDSFDTKKQAYKDNGIWHNFVYTRNAPAGTKTVRMRLIGINGSGLIDAYFDHLSLLVGSFLTLPITLVDFWGTQKNDKSILLQWHTSAEQNSSYIEVERSSNRENNFTTIGKVTAARNSDIMVAYSFTDQYPIAGNDFYRLKVIDVDGKFKYSKIIVITVDSKGPKFQVLNNPFTEQIRVKVNSVAQNKITLTLTDMQGKRCLWQTFDSPAGDSFINIYPASNTPAGLYMLNVKSNTLNQTINVIRR